MPRPAPRSDVSGGGSRQKRRLREGFMAACSSRMVGDSWPCSQPQATGREETASRQARVGHREAILLPKGYGAFRQAAGQPQSHRPWWHLIAPWMWRLETGFSGGRGNVRFTPVLLHTKWFRILNSYQEAFTLKLWVSQHLMPLVLRKLPGLSIPEPLWSDTRST